MANISWPAGLPQTLLAEGLTAHYKDPVIRTDMDAGPAKARLRYTRPPKYFTGSLILDNNERNIFDHFYRATTRYGALRFNFANPQTQEIREYRFREPPNETTIDGLWKIILELEEL
jgi:hypothetical protein